jgi:outer membrane immunogenic protein
LLAAERTFSARAAVFADLTTSQRAEKMTSKFIRTGVAIAALFIATMSAQAADLPRPSYKAPAYSEPAYANWTGFYVGINAGYGFGTSNWTNSIGTTDDFSVKGYMAGGTLGYNYQTGMWVWGLEGDFDFSTMKGSSDRSCGGGISCETKNDWFGTARGRIGYAGWNNFLPYFTGGAAFGDIKADNINGTVTKTKIGWTAGAGLEYALWTNWSIKGEYLYADLGKATCPAGTCFGTDTDVKFKTNIIRLGLNYRF